MILIMKILLHNVHKIIIWRYPTYGYQFSIVLIIIKIECWPVFKQDPTLQKLTRCRHPKTFICISATNPIHNKKRAYDVLQLILFSFMLY